MASEHLKIVDKPQLDNPSMILGFSGWMNGGNVSLGAIEYLKQTLGAGFLAEIHPEVFYIYNFPGNMEVSSIFRPHVEISEGLIRQFRPPVNRFHYDTETNLILFEGREPNFHWREFADCILDVAEQFDVRKLFFLGSVGGVAPHTRDPRMYSSVSLASMKDELSKFGVRFSNYEGPASFVTYLTTACTQRDLPLATLVAEIPAYIQGANPRCIETTLRAVSAMLGLEINFDELRKLSDAFERRIDEAIEDRSELVELIEKLEGDYDNEVFDTQMGDLKDWLEGQGIQVD
jgi:proteasome assembly chaperone (PAC2) family protein